ncbi:MAG: 2-hydroxy-3-oxopropionate reductase [Oleiphilus sp.]|nr:MAG: 2-hydroxy-3-oxopropionate reductase [Oleiphilus sp.]
MKISFIGVGLMGQPMVERLLDSGHSLTLWNRTRAKLEPFSERARLADSVEDALATSDVIITMLENGEVVDQLLYQSEHYRSIQPGATVIDMSSVPPSLARKHAACLRTGQAFYLDAPVSGGTVGARAGTLSVMVGGEPEQFHRFSELFGVFGKATYIGPHGSGQLCKLANQAIVGITIGAVSEALLLASAGGADPSAVKEALSGGFAASRILELHGQRMLDRDFAPGATSRVQLKDMRTILDTARQEELTLPLSEQVHQLYQSHIANGHEQLDHSSLLLELEQINHQKLSDKH